MIATARISLNLEQRDHRASGRSLLRQGLPLMRDGLVVPDLVAKLGRLLVVPNLRRIGPPCVVHRCHDDAPAFGGTQPEVRQ
jgi:hypothetical protein